MKRKILAAVAAAAVVTGGTLALTDNPASAHPPGTCKLIHIDLTQGAVYLLDLCPLG